MNYIKLLRPKNYIKNILILLPLVFSGGFFDSGKIIEILFSFLAFCTMSSAVYIFNDLCDKNKDCSHPLKRHRPIASGAIVVKKAVFLFFLLVIVSAAFNFLACGLQIRPWIFLGCYLLQNILYSLKLKDVPILDISVIAVGFLLRMFYGLAVFDIAVSKWFYLTVLVGSFYLVLSKRKNELALVDDSSTRNVLSFYNYSFLDKNMHICSALTIVFYSLWCVDDSLQTGFDKGHLLWTIPVVILICITYNFSVKKSRTDDIADIVFGNKLLIFLIILLGTMLVCIIYLPVLKS